MKASKKSTRSSPKPAKAAGAANEFYCAGDYVLEDSMGYLMRRVLGLVAHEVERRLEASDLTNAQWVPLLKLFMGLASTGAELARECQLDCGAMTRLLDRLEAKGLCRRVRSVEDRRVVNIELTEAGREAARGIPAVLCQIQNAHLAGFSVEEFETLKGFLRRILDNAQIQTQTLAPTQTISGGPDAP
jgi:DNA-binding MarR family transcriptional regulator